MDNELEQKGIADGVAHAFSFTLSGLTHGESYYQRPHNVIQRGIESAFTQWLNDNRADVLSAIAQADTEDGAGR